MFNLIPVQVVHDFVSFQDRHAAEWRVRDTSLSVMLRFKSKQLDPIAVDLPACECFELHG
jgi:hypothetical protein